MTDWLKRVDITSPLNNILADISKSYKLGVIQSYSFFEQGYEDLNIRLVTDKDMFVIKIFSKYRPVDFINAYANALTTFHNAGIPVPVLRAYNNHHIYAVPGAKQTSYLCVMDFFDGKQFLELTPQKRDIETITKYLARLHKFSFPIQSDYDSWGIANVAKEFAKNKQYIKPEDLVLVTDIVNRFTAIDFSTWRHSVIHGDIQRAHVLKNQKGKYHIIDWGCMANAVSLYDVAIFLSQFCIDLSPDKTAKMIQSTVALYKKETTCSEHELSFLPLLMKASHAAYLIKTSSLIFGEYDTSKQTKDWFDFSRRGLRQLQQLS